MMHAQTTIGSRVSRLDPGEWCSYFQAIEAAGEELLATVVVGAPDMRDCNGALPRRLLGISYDAIARTITVQVGGAHTDGPFLRYFVAAPRSVDVREDAAGKQIAVIGAGGELTLIHVWRARPGPV